MMNQRAIIVLLSRIGFRRKLIAAVSPWVTISASMAPFLRFGFQW